LKTDLFGYEKSAATTPSADNAVGVVKKDAGAA
jgi:hypothetical protein